MEATCDTCHATFEAKRKDARYCSRECHGARNRRVRSLDPRSCQHCGLSFIPWEATTVFCSNTCRGTARVSTSPTVRSMTQAELQDLWRSRRSDLRAAVEDGDRPSAVAAIRARSTVAPGGCWEWQGRRSQSKNSSAPYPVVRLGKRYYQVHRLALEAKHGRPLGSQQAHHICANTMCVNPEHLVPATYAENMAEMKARGSYIARINELELALRELDPNHALLVVAPLNASA